VKSNMPVNVSFIEAAKENSIKKTFRQIV